jgi:hypothetical protein
MQSPIRTQVFTFLCSFASMMLLPAPTWKSHDLEWVCLLEFTPIRRFSFETKGEWIAFLVCSLFVASSSSKEYQIQ